MNPVVAVWAECDEIGWNVKSHPSAHASGEHVMWVGTSDDDAAVLAERVTPELV